MKRTAAELTATIADYYNEKDPYSGLTYSETILAVIDMYEWFRTNDTEQITGIIESLNDDIRNLDEGDEDERHEIENIREIITDIRDTFGIIEPRLTETMIREFMADMPYGKIIHIHIYGENDRQANVITMETNEHGAILWETVLTRWPKEDYIRIHSCEIMHSVRGK